MKQNKLNSTNSISDLFILLKNQKYDDLIRILDTNPKDSSHSDDNINFNIKLKNDTYFIENIIETKNIKLIKSVLQKNISLDILDSNGNLILYNMIKFESKLSEEIIDIVLKKNSTNFGINLLDKQDVNGRTLFQYCVMFENIKFFNKIFEFSLKDNSAEDIINFLDTTTDKQGDNIFFTSLKRSSSVFTSILMLFSKKLKSLPMLKQTNSNGENLLHFCIINQIDDLIEYLIDNNLVDFNQITIDNGFSILHTYLVNTNPNIRNNTSESNTKHSSNLSLLEKIIEKSDILKEDNFGNTILHLLIRESNFELFDIVLESIEKSNANQNDSIRSDSFHTLYNYTNLEGFSAIHLLIDSLSINRIDIFEKKKNLSNQSNVSYSVIEFLIKKSDLNLQNIYGDTCIHLLLKKNLFIKFSKLLEEKEKNIFVENKKRITPFEIIKNYKNEDYDKIMNIIYRSYYNSLKNLSKSKNLDSYTNISTFNFKKLEKWEIDCSKLINSNNSSKEDKYCIQKIKEIVNSKNNFRSIPKEKILKLDFDSGIAINNCFFSGFQIDTLFGLLFLKEKFNIGTVFGYPLTVNDKLEKLYNETGLDYIHQFNFNNIMIYWIYHKISFVNDSNFDEIIRSKSDNKEIVIIPIGIELSNGAHTNILFCDFKNNIIERFEPNGSDPPIYFNYNPELLDKLIENRFSNILSNFTYLPPKKFLPKIGFSMIENIQSPCKNIGDPNGFCTVWCIWYCYQKLLSMNNANSEEFVKYLIKILKLQNKNFKEVIRNFSKNISQLRDQFLKKYNLDINLWISYEYTEDILISMEKDIVQTFGIN